MSTTKLSQEFLLRVLLSYRNIQAFRGHMALLLACFFVFKIIWDPFFSIFDLNIVAIYSLFAMFLSTDQSIKRIFIGGAILIYVSILKS
jgi:hypothetical protein